MCEWEWDDAFEILPSFASSEISQVCRLKCFIFGVNFLSFFLFFFFPPNQNVSKVWNFSTCLGHVMWESWRNPLKGTVWNLCSVRRSLEPWIQKLVRFLDLISTFLSRYIYPFNLTMMPEVMQLSWLGWFANMNYLRCNGKRKRKSQFRLCFSPRGTWHFNLQSVPRYSVKIWRCDLSGRIQK